jgi:glycosyltransferase involved in cell wall biosynthesis
MKLKTVSIVIPVYNEHSSIRELLQKLDKISVQKCNIIEYIIIDDGSTDGSFTEISTFRNQTKRHVVIIRFRKNLGKSAALSVGFTKVTGEYIVTLDADLQDDPDEIPLLLQELDVGNDMVIGWRKNRQDPKSKKISSWIFNTIVARLYGVSLHDMNSGLKVFTHEVAHEIRIYGELHRFLPVLAAARGFQVTERPVVHHTRRFGKSKFGNRRIMHAFYDLTSTLFLTTFEHEPMQVFGTAGSIGIFIGIAILIYLSVLHFSGQSIIGRPLLLLGILFVLFGMQIVSTGLIGELIIHNRRDSESYPVAEIIE